jgi:hypothetical protein
METRDDKLVVSASEQLRELKDLTLTARTKFSDIDYPRGTLSPTTPAAAEGKWTQAVWKAQNLITRQSMGIAMPRRANAGPIVARMSLFAPVSLAFFFTVLLAVVVLKGIPLHPMHLLLVAAGFFAFHILLSYLADVMNIHPAFWVSAAVSVLLVTSYLRLVAGVKFAVLYAGAAQLVYLVGFSYAFFWVGRTGLTADTGSAASSGASHDAAADYAAAGGGARQELTGAPELDANQEIGVPGYGLPCFACGYAGLRRLLATNHRLLP